ncbi:MAG: hypothetical protein NT173_00570, partial [Opitutales bacterium]|nr:hypothetical protein [Opitutales bacterium]
GEGVVFHWTTPLPLTLDAGRRRAVIEGRRGRAILTWADGIEAACEELPLEEACWKDVLRQRREVYLMTTLLPATQPRLTLIQRGRSGRLVVRVSLEPKDPATGPAAAAAQA